MQLVADVHGAADALAKVAAADDQLLVLGDLINFIDYRTFDGIVASVIGTDAVREIVRLRTARQWAEARQVWREASPETGADLRSRYREATADAYVEVCAALEGSAAIVTYGNADQPDQLAEQLPGDCRFVTAETVDVDGLKVGIVGGGSETPLGVPGEVSDAVLAERLAEVGPVDVLCTHVAPAIPQLSTDVLGGSHKGSTPVLNYIIEHQPPFHYFGDIHQPQATEWSIGKTRCRNVGYFRATQRPVAHPA